MIRLAPRFAELATATNFSFLRGASHPEEFVARAAELGLTGIGVADRNTLAGVVRAHVYARENRARSRRVARRHRRAAELRRRRARHARLPQKSRRLWAAVPAADQRQSARAQGRVPFELRGSARAWRGLADRRDAEAATASPSPPPHAPTPLPQGERGGRASLAPSPSLPRPPVDRREPDLRRGHARRACAARGAGEACRRAADRDQRRSHARARAARARRCRSPASARKRRWRRRGG